MEDLVKFHGDFWGINLYQPALFCRFSQPTVHFSRFKHDNLLLSTAIFSGYNQENRLTEPAKKGQVGSFYRYRLIPHLSALKNF